MTTPISTQGVCGRRTGAGRRRDCPARSGCPPRRHSAPDRRGRAHPPRTGGPPGRPPATGTPQRSRARVGWSVLEEVKDLRSPDWAHRLLRKASPAGPRDPPAAAATGDRDCFVRSNPGRIMSGPPGPEGHVSRTRTPESRGTRTRRASTVRGAWRRPRREDARRAAGRGPAGWAVCPWKRSESRPAERTGPRRTGG